MPTSVPNLIQAIEARGGHFSIANDRLCLQPQTAAIENYLLHEQEIIATILERDAAAWRQPFKLWLQSYCVQRPRDAAGFNILFKHFQAWATDPKLPPCYPNLFEYLLADAGYEINFIANIQLVSGLILSEDANVRNLCNQYPLP